MPFPKGQNPNHPAAGSTIKVEPIRDKKAIARIKKILADRPRDLCLFTLGINTAYRANELLSLKVRQVKNLQAGDVLDLKQRNTNSLNTCYRWCFQNGMPAHKRSNDRLGQRFQPCPHQ